MTKKKYLDKGDLREKVPVPVPVHHGREVAGLREPVTWHPQSGRSRMCACCCSVPFPRWYSTDSSAQGMAFPTVEIGLPPAINAIKIIPLQACPEA